MIISHGGGDRGTYKGLSWYRKHFRLPAALAGHKVFLEFEGMRQAGDIYLNGKAVGLYENGVNRLRHRHHRRPRARRQGERPRRQGGQLRQLPRARLLPPPTPRTPTAPPASPTGYEWNANDFNPNHGGINRSVWLHVTGKIHQTLPLYYGLESQGVYVHADNFDIARARPPTSPSTPRSHNTSGDRATVGLSVVVVDHAGKRPRRV